MGRDTVPRSVFRRVFKSACLRDRTCSYNIRSIQASRLGDLDMRNYEFERRDKFLGLSRAEVSHRTRTVFRHRLRPFRTMRWRIAISNRLEELRRMACWLSSRQNSSTSGGAFCLPVWWPPIDGICEVGEGYYTALLDSAASHYYYPLGGRKHRTSASSQPACRFRLG
jgi:hypothetical protein